MSNQGKQPHFADRGARSWSRDERRTNRKQMRSSAEEYAIDDSVSSNDDNYVDKRRPKRRRENRDFCRRKPGREHEFIFARSINGWFKMWDEYRCASCGKKKMVGGF